MRLEAWHAYSADSSSREVVQGLPNQDSRALVLGQDQPPDLAPLLCEDSTCGGNVESPPVMEGDMNSKISEAMFELTSVIDGMSARLSRLRREPANATERSPHRISSHPDSVRSAKDHAGVDLRSERTGYQR